MNQNSFQEKQIFESPQINSNPQPNYNKLKQQYLKYQPFDLVNELLIQIKQNHQITSQYHRLLKKFNQVQKQNYEKTREYKRLEDNQQKYSSKLKDLEDEVNIKKSQFGSQNEKIVWSQKYKQLKNYMEIFTKQVALLQKQFRERHLKLTQINKNQKLELQTTYLKLQQIQKAKIITQRQIQKKNVNIKQLLQFVQMLQDKIKNLQDIQRISQSSFSNSLTQQNYKTQYLNLEKQLIQAKNENLRLVELLNKNNEVMQNGEIQIKTLVDELNELRKGNKEIGKKFLKAQSQSQKDKNVKEMIPQKRQQTNMSQKSKVSNIPSQNKSNNYLHYPIQINQYSKSNKSHKSNIQLSSIKQQQQISENYISTPLQKTKEFKLNDFQNKLQKQKYLSPIKSKKFLSSSAIKMASLKNKNLIQSQKNNSPEKKRLAQQNQNKNIIADFNSINQYPFNNNVYNQ